MHSHEYVFIWEMILPWVDEHEYVSLDAMPFDV